MKIGHPAEKPTLPVIGPASAPAETAKPATGATTSGAAPAPAATSDASAKVEISSTASTLLSGGGSASDFDAEKVGRVGEQIASGSYKVNPEAIADKLIANAQELLTKVRG